MTRDPAVAWAAELRGHERAITERWPRLWITLEKAGREGRAKLAEEGLWPEWCPVPMGLTLAVLESYGTPRLEAATALASVHALALWRAGRIVARFDGRLAGELDATDPPKEVPPEVLWRLPAWCVAVWDTPAPWLAHLDWDPRGWVELRIVFSAAGELMGVPVPLRAETLAECLERIEAPIPHHLRGVLAERLEPVVGRVVARLCWLAADQPDIRGRRPPTPGERARVDGPGGELQVWDVGVRTGAALRGYDEQQHGGTGGGGRVRAHLRRAHWHTYWTGPRTDPTPALRWVHPTLVGSGDLPATVRPVR